jgi:hypothetical protein
MSEVVKNEVMKAQDDTTIDGAFRIATAMSKTDMVPKHFQNKPTDCFLAVQIAKRLNVDVFAVLQNLYVVHGTPAFSAKFLIAMANKSGTFATPIMFRWEGEGDALKATAYAKHASSGEEVSYEFSMADAKAEGYTKNPKYKSMGRLMLAYRAATLFTRLYCPETAMGATTVEEVEDMRSASATASPAPYDDAIDIIPDAAPAVEVAPEIIHAEKVDNGQLL